MAKKKKEPEQTAKADSATELVPASKPHLFQKGKSGNPKGRPEGSRNKASLAIEAMMEGEYEAITEKAIELAKAGDLVAIRVVLDRIAPIRRERPIHLENMPDLQNPENAMSAVAKIVQGMTDGIISPSEANSAALLVGTFLKAVEASDIVKHLERIETQLKAQQNGQPRK
jgi:hypothetical protein